MEARIRIRLMGGVATSVVAALVLMGPAAASEHDEFRITGEIDGLYPGAEATLRARVTNPMPLTIRVTSVDVTVQDASPDCPARMLEVEGPRGTTDVPPGGTGTVPLDVRMDRSATDACQGVTWRLGFVATAVEVEEASGAPAGPSGPGGLALTGGSLVLLLVLAASLAVAGFLALREGRRRGGEVRT